MMGSEGTAKGSLSMMTQLSCSPWTSMPCQKELEVPKRTALGGVAELLQQDVAGGGALHEERVGELG